MKDILFFSNNNSKVVEIKSIFKKYNINLRSLNDFKIKEKPEEKGSSFAENAKIKSIYGFKKTKFTCFADDSGICIDALNGKPGIYSKRFLNSFKNNYDCFKFIINKAKKTNNFRAFFKTSICLTTGIRHHIVFEGIVSGTISIFPSGSKGFGYDPIFIPSGQSKTFAEMNTRNKNLLSHRSIAINKLLNFITD